MGGLLDNIATVSHAGWAERLDSPQHGMEYMGQRKRERDADNMIKQTVATCILPNTNTMK